MLTIASICLFLAFELYLLILFLHFPFFLFKPILFFNFVQVIAGIPKQRLSFSCWNSLIFWMPRPSQTHQWKVHYILQVNSMYLYYLVPLVTLVIYITSLDVGLYDSLQIGQLLPLVRSGSLGSANPQINII